MSTAQRCSTQCQTYKIAKNNMKPGSDAVLQYREILNIKSDDAHVDEDDFSDKEKAVLQELHELSQTEDYDYITDMWLKSKSK
jgi:hypothetical protein